jgi:FkbM family methyltransferase
MAIKNQIHSLRVLGYVVLNIKNWPEFLWLHFFKHKNKMIINFRNGYTIEVRPRFSDVTMLMESWGMKYYNPPGFEMHENDIVIDIGAHIGSFTLYASKFVTTGKIYSFEPLPENYSMLIKNVKINNIQNIKTYKIAISNYTGTSHLHLYDGPHTGSSSLYERNSKKKIKIKTITLEKFIKENKIKQIDFIKIDCEGAEYDILFNAPDKVLAIIKKISMEYHDSINNHKHNELMTFFRKKGFIARLEGEFIYAENKKFLAYKK